jgi:D-psicose/D-tagatose/L-ribulose 3-epimerase
MTKPYATAIHPSVWGPRWDAEGIRPTLEAAARIGYDHVVIPLRSMAGLDPKALARAFAAHNLVPLNTAGVPPDADIGSVDGDVRQRGLQHLLSAVSMARDMGSPQINGVLYAPLVRASGPADMDALYRSADSMAIIGRYAASAGVRLAVEVVNRYETNVLNTARQALDYVGRVNEDNVGIHLDTFHMSIEEAAPLQALRDAMPKLFYFELDQSHRGALGAGSMDLEAMARVAAEAGYRGIVGVEAFARSRMDADHANALAIWRDTFIDADALAAEALLTIKRAFAHVD